MRARQVAGLVASFLLGLACTPKDGKQGTVTAARGGQSGVVSKCLEGCARVESCQDELAVDPGALASCEADCRGVAGEGAQNTALLDRCLERPTCMGFADCLRGEPARSGPLMVTSTGTRGCEPLCGQVGDCLIGLGSETPVAAARIETNCLGICLDNTAKEGLDTEMLACGDKRYCTDLVGCVSKAWTPGASGHAPREAVVGDGDDCKMLCDFLVRCDPSSSISADECKMMCGPIVSMFKPGSIQGCVTIQECEAATECLGNSAADGIQGPSGTSTP